jgi:nucleotide-binding universal stress UspA family protein
MQAGAELFVMGGYGHARLFEMVLGAVTSIMLSEVELPLLMSY